MRSLFRQMERRLVGGEEAVSNPYGELGWLDAGLPGVVEKGEFIEAEWESDLFGFAGRERHACETLQAANWLFKAHTSIAHIALNDFRRSDAAGVGDSRLSDHKG